MKYLVIGAITFLAISIGSYSFAGEPVRGMTVEAADIVDHGGGCRKNSSYGQCCHMERRSGWVHCH